MFVVLIKYIQNPTTFCSYPVLSQHPLSPGIPQWPLPKPASSSVSFLRSTLCKATFNPLETGMSVFCSKLYHGFSHWVKVKDLEVTAKTCIRGAPFVLESDLLPFLFPGFTPVMLASLEHAVTVFSIWNLLSPYIHLANSLTSLKPFVLVSFL
jgi:hypothetical protein